VDVALAERSDLGSILQIGRVSVRDAYSGLLTDEAIEAMLSTTYTVEAAQRRWEDHPIFLVATEGTVHSFADAFVEEGSVMLSELCTLPRFRRKGAATALVQNIRHLDPSLPVTTDVILGNRPAESFLEHVGFVPGECITSQLYGERVVERRWYQSPLAES